ncbi:SHOCT domain-containing protein [Promicromonospora sp. NPDC052451]|uniref:SHOCT domain-containing protein n=1 Tax=Promicromonospora sp. NPDC052451 TaxID=3364407 RepID=UPI0037CBEE55
MMWNWGGYGWIAGLIMMASMVLFWGAVIVGLVFLVRGSANQRPHDDRADAEQLLAGRFAGGEIDENEYRARLAVLRSARYQH